MLLLHDRRNGGRFEEGLSWDEMCISERSG